MSIVGITAIYRVSTEASLASLTGQVGDMAYTLDTHLAFQWNGTTWASVGGGGGGASDATTGSKGIVQLAGDLGGTAASPTTPTAVHLTGTETIAGVKTFSSSPIVPTPTTSTQATNKSYVDGVAGAGAPDASSGVKGIVQLTGDLGGTATAPTTPTAVHITGAETVVGVKTFSDKPVLSAGLSIADATHIDVGTSTGTKIGTSTGQKIAFYNSTPIAQQGATVDIGTVLSALGLRGSGTAFPIATSGAAAFAGSFRFGELVVSASATLVAGTSVPYQLVNATSGAVTLTLPATTTVGYIYDVIKTDSSINTVTLSATSINGSSTKVLSLQYDRVRVISTSTSGTWYIVG